MRPALELAVIAALLLAGCAADVPTSVAPHADAPRAAETARYVSLDASDLRAVTLTALPATVLDSSGERLDAVEIRREISGEARGKPYVALSSEFLDADLRPFLVVAPCKANGVGVGSEPCKDGRLSGSYMQEGLPGLLGAAPFLGAPADALVEVEVTIFGRPRTLTYEGAPSPSHGPGCIVWGSSEVVPAFRDQRFYLLASVPFRLVVCPDSAFPVEVQSEDFWLRRGSLVPGAEPLRASRVAPPAFADPSPEARAVLGPSSLSSYAPSGFGLSEAFEFLLTSDEEGRPFAGRGAAFVSGSTWTRSMIAFRETDLMRESEATLAIRDAAGNGIQKTLTKKCQAVHCVIEAAPATRLDVEIADPVVSLPQERLFAIANATFGGGPWDFYWATPQFRTAGGAPFSTDGRLLHVFYQEPPSSEGLTIGVPHTVYVDGATGTVLAFDIPERLGRARVMPSS